MRHARDVLFNNCSLALGKAADGRPAIVMDGVDGVTWQGGTVLAGTGSGCQLRLRNVTAANLNGTKLESCVWTPKKELSGQPAHRDRVP